MLGYARDTHGLSMMITPVLVRDDAMLWHQPVAQLRGQLPHEPMAVGAIPTSEVTADQHGRAARLLEARDLPICITAHTLCFGPRGRGWQGYVGMCCYASTQVEKVEKWSDRPTLTIAHGRARGMTGCGPRLCWRAAGLAYRTVVLCTGVIWALGRFQDH